MKSSRLKNKANRSKNLVDIANYRKQRSLVGSLNSQGKSKYRNELFKYQKLKIILGNLQAVLFK